MYIYYLVIIYCFILNDIHNQTYKRYDDLPNEAIEGETLNISPQDY